MQKGRGVLTQKKKEKKAVGEDVFMKQYCPQVLGKVLTLIISNNELRVRPFFGSFFSIFLLLLSALFHAGHMNLYAHEARWSFTSLFLRLKRNFNEV